MQGEGTVQGGGTVQGEGDDVRRRDNARRKGWCMEMGNDARRGGRRKEKGTI